MSKLPRARLPKAPVKRKALLLKTTKVKTLTPNQAEALKKKLIADDSVRECYNPKLARYFILKGAVMALQQHNIKLDSRSAFNWMFHTD